MPTGCIGMPSGCQQDANRMPTGCHQYADRIPSGCRQDANRMPAGCRQDANRMPSGWHHAKWRRRREQTDNGRRMCRQNQLPAPQAPGNLGGIPFGGSHAFCPKGTLQKMGFPTQHCSPGKIMERRRTKKQALLWGGGYYLGDKVEAWRASRT
eukprot:gene16549-biopygen15828